MSRNEAMEKFISEVMRTMSHLQFYLEAHDKVAKENNQKQTNGHQEQQQG